MLILQKTGIMTHLPKLALVGRPNVGKSALFNRICNKRISIVDEAEGVTRDRLYAESSLFGFDFEIIDTGGINPRSKALFNEEVKRQAEIAIEEADTIVMVVDSVIGVTDLDLEVARILKRTSKPLTLAVNKVDNQNEDEAIYPFRQLGIPHLVAVSAEHGWHIAELLEAAFEGFDRNQPEIEVSPSLKIAVVGRPNVGKSSLVNKILNDERCVVSPIAGTTRDAIDINFLQDGKEYTLIDTAGIRKKGAEHEVVDKFAAIRSQNAIERADICLLMIDAVEGLTLQEKKIANTIEEEGKGCIILFNKWDLVKGVRMEHILKSLREEVPFLEYCPVLFISAKSGRNLDKIFPAIDEVRAFSMQRIATPILNKFVGNCIQRNHPPMMQGKRLRVYYMAQVATAPPIFVLFTNYPTLMTSDYKKYLYNQFRKEFGYTGVPIRFSLRGKKRETEETKEDEEEVEEFEEPEAIVTFEEEEE